jgi:hypothetical protein
MSPWTLGSSDLWVPDAQACNTSQTQAGCQAGGIYHPDDSSTYAQLSNTPVIITYGIGEATGYIANETVHFQGVEIKDQYFFNVFNVTQQNGIGILGGRLRS